MLHAFALLITSKGLFPYERSLYEEMCQGARQIVAFVL